MSISTASTGFGFVLTQYVPGLYETKVLCLALNIVFQDFAFRLAYVNTFSVTSSLFKYPYQASNKGIQMFTRNPC
jgi:hypothetical protein